MYIYIVAIIIAVVLIVILFFALRSTVKRIDYNTKRYFIDKLQDYDYLIDEKKKVLEELNIEIEKNKKVLSNMSKQKRVSSNVTKFKYYNNSGIPKYMDEELFKKYKNIKNKFSFNKESLIKNFVNDIKQDNNNDYHVLVGLNQKFTNKCIYEMMRLRGNEQKQYLYNLLSEYDMNIIKKYINIDNFKINDIKVKLETLIEKNDPVVYVYTGEKNKNYDYISPLIKTQYDENINEGIKINYKGTLYDYSL